jgi:integrase/recombinase XerC
MRLATVRRIGSPRMLRTVEDVEDVEQEIVDQYALAMTAAGPSDGHVGNCRSVIVEFARSLSGPLWSATCDDADRFLFEQRRVGRSVSTRAGKAGSLAAFHDFMVSRYQGDIHALTGFVVGGGLFPSLGHPDLEHTYTPVPRTRDTT